MTTIMDFLTSQEVFIVVLIAIGVCVIGTIYFIIERIFKRQKNKKEEALFNTTNNKIIKIVDNKVIVEPVLDQIINTNKNDNKQAEVMAVKEEIKENKEQNVNVQIPIIDNKVENKVNNSQLVIPIEELNVVEEKKEEVNKISDNQYERKYKENSNHIDKIEYTEIEPNKEQAREEIRKATEELLRTQELQLKDKIDLREFEKEQEENAIISMDELYEKSKTLYEQNEITQYKDEGDEPISIADLERRMNRIKTDSIELEVEEEIKIQEPIEVLKEDNTMKLDDINTINNTSVNELYKDDKIFKSSPVISPIFGIENQTNDMEFENTANYEKFDDEIKKTNEFLKVLKELQKKLD